MGAWLRQQLVLALFSLQHCRAANMAGGQAMAVMVRGARWQLPGWQTFPAGRK